MSVRKGVIGLAAVFCVVVGSLSTSAQPFAVSDVPPELRPWVPWVLDRFSEQKCPFVSDQYVCLWPGELVIDLDRSGGDFELSVRMDKLTVVRLPGGTRHWPQDVRVDGKQSVVLDEGGPGVRLPAGEHRITGRFFFDELPQEMDVPPEIAMVKLTVGQERVLFPMRHENGAVRLQGISSTEEEGERLDLTVMRKITDGIPLIVETRLVLRVSGKAREVTFKGAQIPGTVPLSVDAGIPARLSDSGDLTVQVRAGTHTVTIRSRTESSLTSLVSVLRTAPWPDTEIWAWQPDESLRQVTVSGPPGVDPSRTSLPDEWRGLAAFQVDLGMKLTIEIKRRGQPEPPPDQLILSREIWMDLDDKGYTFRDSFTGNLNRSWRMDLEAKGILGHVSVDGQDQLITRNPTNGKSGVELRSKTLAMIAEWRSKGNRSDLPAVGWSSNVQQLNATLHLPPGWTVLFTKGVDELPGTWWDRWDLWGFFFVLIISFAVARLTKPVFGGLAFVALVLCYHEPNSPVAVWGSLLASLGLLKVLPEGKLRFVGKVWCWLSVVWLAVVLIPFSVQQVRGGLFPQIEQGDSDFLRFASYSEQPAQKGPPESGLSYQDQLLNSNLSAGKQQESAPKRADEEVELDKKQAETANEEVVEDVPNALPAPGSRSRETSIASDNATQSVGSQARNSYEDQGRKLSNLQQDPKAVVQTGPGVPGWNWMSMNLSWSGPVTKDYRFKLYMISPTVNLMVSILRVLLLVFIALRLAQEIIMVVKTPGKGIRFGSPKSDAAKAATAGVVLAVLLLKPIGAAAEETPSDAILTELLEKLTRAPACRPNCVSASKVQVTVRGDRIAFRAEIHAGETSSWPIPGPSKNWVPSQVRMDGRPITALTLRQDGFIHARVEPGFHEIAAEGPVPPGNTVTVEFGLVPRYVEADAPGFTVEGIGDDGQTEGSIQLSRSARPGSGTREGAAFEEGSYPPWLEITRTFDFGIPWLLHTHVRRVSPAGTPLLTRIPLVNGESVTESDLTVEQGEVVVNMGRDDTDLYWSSTLKEQPRMKLDAAAGKPWTEIWVVKCSPVWQCSFEGLPPVDTHMTQSFEPVFMPWPGESVVLNLTRPGGTEGQSVTIDSARLTLSPGIRLVKAELSLWIRSSQGGVQELVLPKGAEVQKLTVDGAERTFRVQGERLEVNLTPGAQIIEAIWQQSGGIRTLYRVPKVRLGRDCANVTVTVNLPGDRWLLLAGGPDWGPAVLFWGYLLTILLGGLILGRIRISPLKSWQWMLFALGLTQVPVGVTLVIVGWFLVLSWRGKEPPRHVIFHNVFQIALSLWTVIAVGCLVGVVYNGLAVQPDMQVEGAGSNNTHLVWYMDRIYDALPTSWIASFPILVWKIIMLGWALWLAGSIIRWAPWAWRSFSAETLWRRRSKKPKDTVSITSAKKSTTASAAPELESAPD